MVAPTERQLRMFVVHEKSPDGFFLVLVPADLLHQQVAAALEELGVDGEEALEVGGWRAAKCGVAVVRVPFLARN